VAAIEWVMSPVHEHAECPTDAKDAIVPSWTVGEASMDKWASWLLHRRDGDDPEQRVRALEHSSRSGTACSRTRASARTRSCSMSEQVTG
jgi:hypothetical protein